MSDEQNEPVTAQVEEPTPDPPPEPDAISASGDESPELGTVSGDEIAEPELASGDEPPEPDAATSTDELPTVPAVSAEEDPSADEPPEPDATPGVPSARQQERAAVVAIKEALVAQAERGAITWDRAQGLAELKRLMDEWKQAGHAAKGQDARLWERFRTARDLFYTRLDLEQSQRRTAAAQARARKEELIAEATRAAELPDVRQVADRLAELMTAWKQAGHAGKGPDDELWRRFKAIQDEGFARRAADRRQNAEAQAEAATAKRAIIAQAEALVGAIDLGVARTRMRDLVEQFHAAGFAGRSVNPDLNALFRQAQDAFYEWAHAEPERRKTSGVRDQYYVRARKLQDAGEVRREIERVEKELSASAPGGKRQHGSGITLSLGDLSKNNQLRAELMRLRLREQQLASQVTGIETRIAQVGDDAPGSPLGEHGEDAVEGDRPPEAVSDDVSDADRDDAHDDREQDRADDPADRMALGE